MGSATSICISPINNSTTSPLDNLSPSWPSGSAEAPNTSKPSTRSTPQPHLEMSSFMKSTSPAIKKV